MILVLRSGVGEAEVEDVVLALTAAGARSRVLRGAGRPLVHVLERPRGGVRRFARHRAVEGVEPLSRSRQRRIGRPFYPHHFLGWCAAMLLLSGALVLLSGFFPRGLGESPDPRLPPAEVQAPWYLRPLSGLLHLFPPGWEWAAWLAAALLALTACLVPALDRGRGRLPGAPALAAGLALAAAALALSVLGG
ncbi:MAG: hypothetical protein EYC70_02290 [Planctomycetota bacterium]|nr:MAG: hypothetical protein EYC70_02290 [Planctomycetota bacterium]